MFVSICLRDGWGSAPRPVLRGPCSSPRAPVMLRWHGAQRCYVNTALPFIVQPQRPNYLQKGSDSHPSMARVLARITGSSYVQRRRPSSCHRSIIPSHPAGPKGSPTRLPKRCETMRSVACIAMLLINAASLRPSQRRPRLQAPCTAAANRQATQRDAAP